MFKSGEFTSEYVTQLDGSPVPDKQVQPHGVELTVDKIFRCSNYTVLGDEKYAKAPRHEATKSGPGKFIDKSDDVNHRRKAVQEVNRSDSDDNDVAEDSEQFIVLDKPHYTLIDGPYVVRYNEKISVPEDHVGFVWPRSRLIRSGNFLTSAVWDSGYEGRGEGGLHINCMTFLEKGMRLGQFVLARASVMEQYEGSHDKENLEQ